MLKKKRDREREIERKRDKAKEDERERKKKTEGQKNVCITRLTIEEVKLFVCFSFFQDGQMNNTHAHTHTHIYIFIYRTATQVREIHTQTHKRRVMVSGDRKKKRIVYKSMLKNEKKKERCSGEDTR
jgi:hypothetical protein